MDGVFLFVFKAKTILHSMMIIYLVLSFKRKQWTKLNSRHLCLNQSRETVKACNKNCSNVFYYDLIVKCLLAKMFFLLVMEVNMITIV